MEVDFLLRLEKLKVDLRSLPGFNTRHLYKAVAQPNNQGIDQTALRRFLIKVGHRPLKQELSNVMRRIDLSGRRQVSLEEFTEAIEPI